MTLEKTWNGAISAVPMDNLQRDQSASFSFAPVGKPPTGQQATPTVERVKDSTCSRVFSASFTQLR